MAPQLSRCGRSSGWAHNRPLPLGSGTHSQMAGQIPASGLSPLRRSIAGRSRTRVRGVLGSRSNCAPAPLQPMRYLTTGYWISSRNLQLYGMCLLVAVSARSAGTLLDGRDCSAAGPCL